MHKKGGAILGRPKKKAEEPNHGKYYEVKRMVTNRDGSKTRKSFYSLISKADAERQAKEFQNNLLLGRAEATSRISFERCARDWLELNKEHSVSAATYEYTYRYSVESHLIPYFGKYSIANIRKNDIQKFFIEKRKFSDSTLHKLNITLYAIFESAVENDYIYKNPCKHIVIPKSEAAHKIMRPYTLEQTKAVIKFAKKTVIGLSAIIMLKTGVRREELLGLRWDEDIDLKNKIIHIRQAVTETRGALEIGPPKTPTSIREIPIDDELCRILATVPRKVTRYKGRGKDRVAYSVENKYVIAGRDGGPMYPSHWQQRIYKPFMDMVAEKCKTKGQSVYAARAHELRHTYGTLLYKSGTDIYTISKLMGHSSVVITTRIYIENDTETIKKAMKMNW